MRNSFERAVTILAVAAIASGCASHGVAKQEDEKALHKAEAPAIAMLLESCPVNPAGGQAESLLSLTAIAAVQAFAPAIIGFGYDLVVKALEERVDALSASTSATAKGTLYRQRSGNPSTTPVPVA
jgi:hypothetical protein